MLHYQRSNYYLTALLFLAAPIAAAAEDAPASNWNGIYIGGSAGLGFGGDSNSLDLDGFNYFCDDKSGCPSIPGEVTDAGTDTAFIGGGQVGFNYALSNRWVIGIDADFSAFDFSTSRTPASSKADWGADTLVIVEMNWLATVRGRVGYAVDQWLIYGTGGVAFNDGQYRNYDFCKDESLNCGSGLMDARGDMDAGWTMGGGVELALSSTLSAKAEYLFVRFDGKQYTGTAEFPANKDEQFVDYRFSASPTDLNILRLGLNYKFGEPAR
jgi:outer membrane immunogenic protein